MKKLKVSFVFVEVFKKCVDEEWKCVERDLKPVLEELEEDSENRQTPDSLISEEDTVDR